MSQWSPLRAGLAGLILCSASAPAQSAEPFQAGFASVDVTPQEPVRLSGYAARTAPMEGVDEPLAARAVALKFGDDPPYVLVAVDSIGFPGTLVKEVFERLPEEVQVDRSQFVMTATHSHTAPHIARGLSNLYSKPQSDEELAATERYTNFLRDQAAEAARRALADLKPARLFVGEGTAGFAMNRRGIGEPAGRAVDHAVPVLRITDASGQATRGLMFNYACHCTTFGPGHNRVNGDWAGYASLQLEREHPGAVALCMIGCGADANPHREGPQQLELAQMQGRDLADEVTRVCGAGLREITAPLFGTFGYAGLPIDRPGLPELQAQLKSGDPNYRRHAEEMLAVHARMGRLPETYPMPIQVWRFGNEFAMVFLGGEVVADYSHRIKRELGPRPADDAPDADEVEDRCEAPVWVTAYANDVFGYVASERVRSEGGYEVDSSMIYYLQPGRWSSGTEEVVMRRVHELYGNTTTDRSLSVEDALRSFTVPEGFRVEVVAAEPLIADPVNFTVGPDGRLWVVEMGDYPRGADHQGAPGGRIRVLTDDDGNGRYDHSTIFLDQIAYPTGVWPWRDGAIISAAPDIVFARDLDGDGRADDIQVLYSGFKPANPQHRINGFCWGLDGWLYLASGDTSRTITSHKTGETLNMAGRDLRIHPDTGRMETLSGQSQYGRTRDNWGNGFGNNNSEPLWQYVLEDGDLNRNPFVPSPRPLVHLSHPQAIPPVFPTSRTVDRFNDLWAADRFTSACSPLIVRDSALGPDLDGAALICEPVHNLVSRIVLTPGGVAYRGSRLPSEETAEFLSSRNNWFRPVRLMTGPDGSLWVADMYRRVIEHTEWIPEAWQAQLDVRAGENRGRIYRVVRGAVPLGRIPDLSRLTTGELVEELASPNGTRRDLAQQLLIERGDAAALERLDALLQRDLASPSLVQCLWTRVLLDPGRLEPIAPYLSHADPMVRSTAVRLIGGVEPDSEALRQAVLTRRDDDDVRVRFTLALVLGGWTSNSAGDALSELAVRDFGDVWVRAAVLTSARTSAEQILRAVLSRLSESEERTQFTTHLTATALGDQPESGAARILRLVLDGADRSGEDWRFAALGACLDGLARKGSSVARLASSSQSDIQQAARGSQTLFDAARAAVTDSDCPVERRRLAIALLARGPDSQPEDLQRLTETLSPQQPLVLQQAAVDTLAAVATDDVPARLIGAWKSLEPTTHSSVINALLSRDAWTSQLLDAIAAEAIRPSELDAAARNRLLEHPDESLRQRAADLLQPSASRRDVLEQHQSVLTLAGDPDRGAAVFTKTCAACHRLHERGADLGAKLGSLQNKATDALLTAILDPNQAVEGRYLSYAAATNDGRTYAGMIVEETSTSITLARPDGQKDVILRIDLESLSSSGKSFMPEGLERELSPQDIADVIAFVQAESVP
ncbi:MAG: neutral/alkaline non-lysosomal ceramidase N-terminal domain-containing protein [Planctomyces sp.]|nr:neutral/alkaline non-lysosomal ceramidase N-terminal domain-containing protein [Planctomyces sp.]